MRPYRPNLTRANEPCDSPSVSNETSSSICKYLLCARQSSVAEWLECWTQVNFTRARGPGFDSWTDHSKIARPQDSHVVTWPAGDQEKHDSLGLLLRAHPTVAELYPGNIEILA